jgi:pimeloyl-ACP methyl ester carboxylesterase
MKLSGSIAGITGIAFALALLVSYIGLLPVSGNFVRYLYWRMTDSTDTMSGYVSRGDADIHFTRFGSGAPVVLLHGGLSNRISWFSQLPGLVSSGRQVILIDSRGHGRSGLGSAELSYRQLAADVVAVLHRLDIACADVIGWSDGANTALRLARDWPQRVGRMVLISGNFDPDGLTEAAQTDSRQLSHGPAAWLTALWTGAGGELVKLEKRVKAMWRTGPLLTPDDLRLIRQPALVIIGEQDLITRAHARQMATLLSGSTLLVIPGGGHATPVTHASEVNAAIADFFERHARQQC